MMILHGNFTSTRAFQRNANRASLHTLLEADVALLWPAIGTRAPHSALWSAFFGHPRLFDQHVLIFVSRFVGVERGDWQLGRRRFMLRVGVPCATQKRPRSLNFD